MSTRRKIGDIVRVDGYQHDDTPYVAQIVEHGGGIEPDDCILDCGDPACKEWPVVQEVGLDGRLNGERNFHVPECHMLDFDAN
jgi:hypothetical protein